MPKKRLRLKYVQRKFTTPEKLDKVIAEVCEAFDLIEERNDCTLLFMRTDIYGGVKIRVCEGKTRPTAGDHQ